MLDNVHLNKFKRKWNRNNNFIYILYKMFEKTIPYGRVFGNKKHILNLIRSKMYLDIA